jgi:hypothetical protein
VLQVREVTSTPPSVVFTFGFTFEYFKECEGVSNIVEVPPKGLKPKKCKKN